MLQLWQHVNIFTKSRQICLPSQEESLRNDSFLITLCGVDEILSAISNLSAVLQSPSLQVSTLTSLVNGTKEHLKQIAASCKADYSSSDIVQSADRILSEASKIKSPITEDKPRKTTMNVIANFADSVGKEYHNGSITLQ